MNAAVRDIEARLRRACAESAFGAAVAASRQWSSDMAAAVVPDPGTEAMPAVPDVRGLVDPLGDSALAKASLEPCRAEADAAEFSESNERAWLAIVGPFRRARIPVRPAGESARGVAASATLRKSATCALAQIESVLARQGHVGAPFGMPATPRARGESASGSARNVVRLSPQRPKAETAGQPESMRSPRAIASSIARWNDLACGAGRGEFTARADVAAGLRDWQARLSNESDMAGAAFDVAPLAAREAEPKRPDVMLRLGDLTNVAASHRRGANALPPVAAAQRAAMSVSGPVQDPPNALAPDHGSLARVFDSLARIEEQVAAGVRQAEPATQWYDDDDGLADRIHDILRRQVERHGIDLV